MTVAERLSAARAEIDQACRAVGRSPDEVRLLPVTKTVPVDRIREAVAAGVTTFGENRVQEALAKSAELPGVRWSMIGTLQSNKIAPLIRFADELQSLDGVRLAIELDRRLQAAGRPLDVYLQVNVSGEPQKHGVSPAQVETVARELRSCTALRPLGLMTVAVRSAAEDQVAACFQTLARLRDRLRELDDRWSGLSMGMSGDFRLAIRHGATVVRLGRAIFGERFDLDRRPLGRPQAGQ